MKSHYNNFAEFYEAYLNEHQNLNSRRLHFLGTTLVLAVITLENIYDPAHGWAYIAAAGAIGYGLAWLGHFLFEKNMPATFGYPAWSFRAGVRMYVQMLRGRISILRDIPVTKTAEK